MNRPLSVRIDADMRKQLDRWCRKHKVRASDVARDALRRYLAVEQFRSLRSNVLPFAEAQGLLTDEDIFKAVS